MMIMIFNFISLQELHAESRLLRGRQVVVDCALQPYGDLFYFTCKYFKSFDLLPGGGARGRKDSVSEEGPESS